MQANLENSAVATGLERVSFHSSPKEVKVKSLSRVRLLATLPGSSVHGILQSRILKWVAMPSSRRSSQPIDWTSVSCLFCTAGGLFTTEPQGKHPHYRNTYVLVTSMAALLFTNWMSQEGKQVLSCIQESFPSKSVLAFKTTFDTKNPNSIWSGYWA